MKIKRGSKKEHKEQTKLMPKRLPDIIVQRKHNNFTIISNEAIRDPNMSWKAKGLLTLIIGNKDGWYSYKETIKQYGTDGEKSVSSGLKELEKNGYLIRLRYRKKRGKNKQIIGSVWLCSDTVDEFDWNSVKAQLARHGLEAVHTKPKYGKAPSRLATSTKGTMNERYIEPNEQLTIPINNNTKINNKKSLGHLDEFEKWYKHYPKKVSKQTAKQAWIKLFTKIPKKEQPSFETLLSAVKQQSKSEQWQNKKYIPHPSTWLNQRRWDDELEIRNNPSNYYNSYDEEETPEYNQRIPSKYLEYSDPDEKYYNRYDDEYEDPFDDD